MENKFIKILKNPRIIYILAVVFFFSLIISYSNHYNNGFHFDDTHTIVHNEYIKDLKYFSLYFTDIKTFGTMPNNRGYRPMVTAMNAFDFWRGKDDTPGNERGKLDPRNFHVSIMLWYIIQCILIFFLFRNIMNISFSSSWNNLVALLATSWYAHHTANAETINYIISRSDSFSTLCIVASLSIYITDIGKKFHLYLIPFILGILTKETGVMFVPILFFYILLFEKNVSLVEFFLYYKPKRGLIIRTIKETLPSALIGITLFLFTRAVMTPAEKLATGTASNRLEYFFTQANVIKHYIGNFILPLNLSADPDLPYITTILDSRVIFGLSILLTLFIISIYTSKIKKTMPISFGIIWFYLALIPTSSIQPLGQIANDHRTFFPYIGLVLSVSWWIYLLIDRYKERILINKYYPLLIAVSILLVIGGHAYGTHQRNKVWSSEESLWRDVTVKSPNNGRGLMNYGLVLMQKGQYDDALNYFNRALDRLPYYSYLHINLGIIKNAMGFPEEAEIYFIQALKYDPSNAEGYRFYARFLMGKNRKEEAIKMVKTGLNYSPGHSGLILMKQKLDLLTISNEDKLTLQIKAIKENPSVKNYINLSLIYYNMKQFESCIKACEEVLKIDKNNVLAYNNICISYTQLGQKEKAIEACDRALEIKPDFQLAKNNRDLAISLD